MGDRKYWILGLVIALSALSWLPAVADDGPQVSFEGHDQIQIHFGQSETTSDSGSEPPSANDPVSDEVSTGDGATEPIYVPPPMALPGECHTPAVSAGLESPEFCAGPVPVPVVPVPATPGAPLPLPPAAVPVVTSGMVAAALQRVELPASVIEVEPPNGRTLVNFETNFFTESADFATSVVLLGQRVDLRVRAASYVWRFGDGDSAQTSSPGAPYPELVVTHRYLSKGEMSVGVDTVYVADFRVGGGAWAPVPGSVTVVGETEPLEVVTASPILVG